MSDEIIQEEEIEQSSPTTNLITQRTDIDEIVNVDLTQESPPIADNLAQSRKVRKNQLLLQPSIMMRNKNVAGSMTPTGIDVFPLSNNSASNVNEQKIAPVSMFPTAKPREKPGTLPTKNKTAAILGQSNNSLEDSNSSRRLHHLINTNTSHFSN